ncbi:hypothetical protein [Parvularcula sp. LCG005]|uniref:hypothetical protein n=1 Tax=Parvularcula sp. LCG005 TaxID=3078805 RepID=UPI002942FEAF|nr:hypothetical protein [Parvularcula sp. LCG005]WOI53583.1 hypothetical protein RUI03_00980 [Parvularcula sp. LCG005]
MKRRHAVLGASAAALTTMGALALTAAAAPPVLEQDHVIVVDRQGTAAVAEHADDQGLVLSDSHRKWALGAFIGTALAGLISLVGFRGVTSFLSRSGTAAARAVGAAAVVPARAARSVAGAAGRVLKKPGQTVMGFGLLAIVAVLALTFLDLQWKAGLAVGAVSALTSIGAVRKLLKQVGQTRPQPVPVA